MHAVHCVDPLFLSTSIPSTRLLFFKVFTAPIEMCPSVLCHSSHVRAATTNSIGFLPVFVIRVSRYGFLREIQVRIRRKVIEGVAKSQISNSERESEGLRRPMRRSGGGPKVPRVGRASVYLVRAVTKWTTCA